MAIRYKIDVLAALKGAGYSSYRLRKDKIMGESTIQLLRTGQLVTLANLSLLCQLLNCQPGDLVEYVEEPEPTQ